MSTRVSLKEYLTAGGREEVGANEEDKSFNFYFCLKGKKTYFPSVYII